jgi:hypothetical protein
MSTDAVHVLDRHVLSSGAALVDSGKDTFGWTPELAGERAARLKNEVPWGVSTAGAESPPRLEGRDVLSQENYLRLHFAWIPLDNRMGFCVWGAIGDLPLGRTVWRVLTHTALMEVDAFRAMESNPFALLKQAVAGDWVRELAAPGSFDERGPVEPIRVVASAEARDIAEKLRRDDIERLRARLRDLLGAAALKRRLAALYAALSSVPHVALASTSDRQAEMLVRLAWLTLPSVDRWQTSFTTEQGASAGELPRLMALNLTEWQGRIPPGTFHFQGEPPSGSTPSEGQLMWAADIAEAGDLRQHVLAHAFAARVDASLLSGDHIDRYARHRAAVREVCDGARGMQALQNLAAPQFGGLLSTPLRAGLLLGLSLRGSSLGSGQIADALQTVLARLPLEGRDMVARGIVRALALDDDAVVLAEADRDVRTADEELAGESPLPEPRTVTAEFRAAALLRCGAVRMRLVSAVELARLLAGGAEAALLTPLLESPGGPAVLLAAIPAVDHDDLLDRLGPLGDRAMELLPEEDVEPVLDELDFGGASSARWGIRMYETAERTRGYRPSAQVLRRLLQYATHPAVRDYLARPERLFTVLSPAFAEHAGPYIRTVRPDARSLAGALMEASSQRALVPPPPPSAAMHAGFTPPPSTGEPDSGVVTDALKYLLATGETGRVIDVWRGGTGEPNARLFLLAHHAWAMSPAAEHARAAAAALLEGALAPRAEVSLLPATVAAVLRQVVEGGTRTFSDAEGRLAALAVWFLARQKALHLVDSQVWTAFLRQITPAWATQLAIRLVQEAGGAQQPDPRAVEISHDLVSKVLQSSEAERGGTFQEMIQKLSPEEYGAYWSGFFYSVPPDVLARDEVLDVLGASLLGREGAPFAGIVLKRALNHLTFVSAPGLAAVDRLAWTELVHLDRSALDEDAPGNPQGRVRLIVRLLARGATFPLSLHLAEALRRLVPDRPDGVWTNGVLQDHEIEPLKWTSPSSYDRLHPRKEKSSVIFLPANFRIEPPEPAVAPKPEIVVKTEPTRKTPNHVKRK